MPTLLGLCGVAVPNEVDGKDLSTMLTQKDGNQPEYTPIYHYLRATRQAPACWRGIVTRSHTHARFREAAWVLYDDITDPYQMRNLADDPGSSSLQETLEEELQQWLARTGDSFETERELAERLDIKLNEDGAPVQYVQPPIAEEMRNRLQRL